MGAAKKQRDPADWQAKYHAPGTESNRGRFWIMPKLPVVLDDLKCCGGRTAQFVAAITDDADLQQLLMLELHEQLAKEGNEEFADRFRAVVTFGKKAQIGFGIDKALEDYRDSGEMNPTLLSKLGAQAMPETFGTSANQKAEADKVANEEQRQAVDDHIADLE